MCPAARMPPSDLAVVGGGRSALGPQKAGCVRCGFGFGSALPCRALPPAGRAHARLMRAPLAARSAGAALSTRPTVALLRLVLLVLPSLPARLSLSLAARSAGAALSTRPTVALFGGSFCWCCPLYPTDCRSLWSLACGHRGSKADPLPLMGDYHSIILGNFGLMWACDCHPLLLTPALILLGVGVRLSPALTLVLCAPDRLLCPSISRRLYRPFLRHLLHSWLGTVAPLFRHSPAVAILYKSAYSIGFYSSPSCHLSSSSLGSSGGLHS